MCTRPAVLFAFVFVLSGAFAVSSRAQTQSQASAAAPVPAQILSAKNVFISNGGGASDPYTGRYGDFSGGPDRAYNELYAALKTFPKYTLVSAPSDADLVFDISFSEFPVQQEASKGSTTVADAKFRLVVLDPKTHMTLWTITEYAGGAILEGNREKNYVQAMGRVVADLQALTSSTPPGAAAAPVTN
ncbi:MAG: hypothetical protein WBX16_14115 [Candidatus Acidiferrales bacterium]